ncbi:MAG: hypothetical protein FWG98_03265 [Candidatus Cloacimonetes bacterium]|nr:hypothetical protein [Candidatus Cloacimonadota bacterium]
MDKILNYIINEKKQKPLVAEKIASSFAKHDDIRFELESWIENKIFPTENMISIEGYSAEMIYKLAPFMDGVGVYNFLVTLRERPENAKRIIAEGFKRK